MFSRGNRMKRQGGFTLIELIIVMIILGILVAAAAPKFLNFQKDARIAALKGLKASMLSAAHLAYGKAAIKAEETNGTAITLEGIELIYGYPTGSMAGIGAAVTGIGLPADTTADWVVRVASAGQMTVTFKGADAAESALGQNCNVVYTQAKADTTGIKPMSVTINDTSCG